MQRDDLIYLAGLFDGEGCVQLAVQRQGGRETYNLMASLAMVDPLLPKWIYENFGGTIYCARLSRKDAKHRDAWCWSVCGANALAFLEAIQPYVRQKRPQVDLGLEYQRRGPRNMDLETKRFYYQTMRGLKRVNVGDVPIIARPADPQVCLFPVQDQEK